MSLYGGLVQIRLMLSGTSFLSPGKRVYANYIVSDHGTSASRTGVPCTRSRSSPPNLVTNQGGNVPDAITHAVIILNTCKAGYVLRGSAVV